jgi:hypothetical protein
MVKNLPQWAIVILLGALSFLLVTFIDDLKAQDAAAKKEIDLCKKTIAQLESNLASLDMGIGKEVTAIKEKIQDIKTDQKEVRSGVIDNSRKIDRIGYILEQMADKQGIK